MRWRERPCYRTWANPRAEIKVDPRAALSAAPGTAGSRAGPTDLHREIGGGATIGRLMSVINEIRSHPPGMRTVAGLGAFDRTPNPMPIRGTTDEKVLIHSLRRFSKNKGVPSFSVI